MTLTLLLLACAARAPAPVWSIEATLPPPDLGQVFAAQPPELVFEEAVSRREDGDVRGALERLAWLRAQGDASPAVLYQIGVAYELDEDFESAIGVYDLLLAENPGQYVLDAGFRRGLCLEELGYYDAAYKQYDRIPDGIAFERKDRYTLDIAMGVAALRAGHEREGQRLLQTSLMAVDGTGEITWIAAKGWYTLADHALAEGNEVSLEGGERQQVRGLERRAAYIAEAEAHLVKVIELAEPEWIMAGLLGLGDAYMDLHADITGAPAPKKLTPEQADIYREAVVEQASVLLTKAWSAYDHGLVVAGRFGLENRYTQQLTEARDAVPLP